MSNLSGLEAELLAAVGDAVDLATLDEIRVAALGKKGRITELMKTLGGMAPDERKAFGAAVNQVKDRIAEALTARKSILEDAALEARLGQERIDVTLPIAAQPAGRIHPVTQVTEECVEIFGAMGFALAEGPDIEDDSHNFTALNFPPGHPAREMHDTFFLPPRADGEKILLRTHTSPVQIRTMKGKQPPIRVIAPGRTYRCDSDQTHTPMFHQIEALVIDKGIHMGHLKATIEHFAAAFFEVEAVKIRFRPSFFPFTEPSAEVDIGCARSKDSIRIGQGDDWLEIMGCGMVHPNVIRNCGLDPDEWQGFAFGMGLDRIAMLKYGIPDLRAFFESDLRWLRHYGFAALDLPTLGGGLSR
ncbi:phenylalanine--tRNA ligase subunit alpha [Zavarzinia sp.]|uniref:phenylalanine--tRNA ligase subunit alpha n=1 Tax=Zavarzinia sp. TaxID=2027920 RepID=UPI0035699365